MTKRKKLLGLKLNFKSGKLIWSNLINKWWGDWHKKRTERVVERWWKRRLVEEIFDSGWDRVNYFEMSRRNFQHFRLYEMLVDVMNLFSPFEFLWSIVTPQVHWNLWMKYVRSSKVYLCNCIAFELNFYEKLTAFQTYYYNYKGKRYVDVWKQGFATAFVDHSKLLLKSSLWIWI